MNPRRRALCAGLLAPALVAARGAAAQVPTPPRGKEPDRIRGQVTKVEASSMDVTTRDGRTAHLALPDNVPVFSLAKASFGEVAFGVYVGAISEKLGDHIYSPIIRDSLSWLHKGLELRIIDEKLRGIAVGHTKWDLTPDSVMTHGWVDDIEERVISIKYGPTDEEETDVEVGREIPILRMSPGERSLIRKGARIFAGAQDGGGNYAAVFVFTGQDGIVPPL
jgi:hypothetical protein